MSSHEFYNQAEDPTPEMIAEFLQEVEELTIEAVPIAEFSFNGLTLHALELLIRLGLTNIALTEHAEHECPIAEAAVEMQATTLEHLYTACGFDHSTLGDFGFRMLESIKNVWKENPDQGEWVTDDGD